MLYQLGVVTFEVAPVNTDEVTRKTGADFAAKDVIGAYRPREFTGPADAPVTLSGKLFPQHFGWGSFPALELMSTSGQPQMLIRGDGYVLGWHLITELEQTHTYLDAQGVGRIVEFKLQLQFSPRGPSAGTIFQLLASLF